MGERMPKAAAPLSLLAVKPLGYVENLCGKPQKGHEMGQGRDQGMLLELVMVGRAAKGGAGSMLTIRSSAFSCAMISAPCAASAIAPTTFPPVKVMPLAAICRFAPV